jgi:hypothetical protein
MVGHGVTFGIPLTDEFGGPTDDEMVEVINKLYEENDYEYPVGIASFPSVEDNQLVLGFFVRLHRDINVAELDKQWNDLITKLPPELKAVYDKYDWNKPSFHVMSGEY